MTDSIIITSIISPSDKPLSYCKVRSIYTDKQRFEQTLETINSIRNNMPSTDIILIDCSPPSKYMEELSKNVDYFFNLEFNDIVVNSPEKGKGEATLLLYVLSNIPKEYNNIYKITGRYVLQETFNKSMWEVTNNITVCKTHIYGNPNGIHTFFYKIPDRCISEFKNTLDKYLLTSGNICIENFLGTTLTNLTSVKHIGILCRWAVYNKTDIH
jgi:hypothetical protein